MQVSTPLRTLFAQLIVLVRLRQYASTTSDMADQQEEGSGSGDDLFLLLQASRYEAQDVTRVDSDNADGNR